jgi:hypothetical protein
MATHSGSEGKVFVGSSQIAEVKSWSLEVTSDMVDASIIGTQWRKSHPTIKSWSGSFEAFWDEEDKNGQGKLSAGNTVTLNLYPQGDEVGNPYFSGQVIITSVAYKASFDGLVESSFSFTGTDALNQKIVGKEPAFEAPISPPTPQPASTPASITKPAVIKPTVAEVIKEDKADIKPTIPESTLESTHEIDEKKS